MKKRLIGRVGPLALVCAGVFGSTFSQAAEVSAVLDWVQRVEMSTPVSGVVGQVHVQPGQTVAKGEALLTLDPTLFNADLAEAGAEIERLLQEEVDARRDMERVQELYARTVSSTTELDAAKLRHVRATALLKSAQAGVERAQRRLFESEVKAPFDAVVLERRAEPGLVVASQCQPPALLSLARADSLLARAQIDASQVAGIKLGSAATVTVNGRNLSGQVQAVVASANARYQVEVAFPRPAGLVAGMPARIRLP